MASPSTRRRKAIVALGSLALTLILSELLLRAAGFSSPNFFQPDSRLGWALRPGAEGTFSEEGSSFVHINRDGWREREPSGPKPSGVLRIAVLGDSFVLALQVPAERNFVRLLERELSQCSAAANRSVETLNFGVAGYGTAQELLVLRERVWSYSPDWVLLAFYPGNDLHNNYRPLDSNRARPYFELSSAGDRAGLVLDDAFRHSSAFEWRQLALTRCLGNQLADLRLVQLGKQAQRGVARWRRSSGSRSDGAASESAEAGLDNAGLGLAASAQWSAAWSVTEAMLLAMRDETEAHGARFALVSVTSGIQVHPDPHKREVFARGLGSDNLLFAEARLQACARAAGIPILTLAQPLQEQAQRSGVYFHGFANSDLGKGHWNQDGHAAAASLIAAWLCPQLDASSGSRPVTGSERSTGF